MKGVFVCESKPLERKLEIEGFGGIFTNPSTVVWKERCFMLSQ